MTIVSVKPKIITGSTMAPPHLPTSSPPIKVETMKATEPQTRMEP